MLVHFFFKVYDFGFEVGWYSLNRCVIFDVHVTVHHDKCL